MNDKAPNLPLNLSTHLNVASSLGGSLVSVAGQLAGQAKRLLDNIRQDPSLIETGAKVVSGVIGTAVGAIDSDGDQTLSEIEITELLENPDKMEALLSNLPEAGAARLAASLQQLNTISEGNIEGLLAERGLSDLSEAEIAAGVEQIEADINQVLSEIAQEGGLEDKIFNSPFANMARTAVVGYITAGNEHSTEAVNGVISSSLNHISGALPKEVELPPMGEITTSAEVNAVLEQYSASTGIPADVQLNAPLPVKPASPDQGIA